MKKLSAFFALLALVLVLGGCSQEQPAPHEEPIHTEQTKPSQEIGLETEEDTEITGDKTFEAAKQELELLSE